MVMTHSLSYKADHRHFLNHRLKHVHQPPLEKESDSSPRARKQLLVWVKLSCCRPTGYAEKSHRHVHTIRRTCIMVSKRTTCPRCPPPESLAIATARSCSTT